MARILRSGAIIVILLAVGWMSLHFLTKVGTADVIAYNEFQRPAASGTRQLSAGDVVILYDNGDMMPICDLNLEQSKFADTDMTSSYVNTLAESLPFFARVAHTFGAISGNGKATKDLDTSPVFSSHLIFQGKEFSLREISSAPITDTCQCEMAQWATRGIRVCTVNAAMVETRNISTPEGPKTSSRTVAVTLARHTNFVTPQQFENCKIEPTKESQVVQQRLCNDGQGQLPLDVRARRLLNLIDERPFSTVSAVVQ